MTNDKPTPPASFTPEYFEQRIALQRAIVNAANAQVCAMDIYQNLMRELGKLSLLEEQQAEFLAQQGEKEQS